MSAVAGNTECTLLAGDEGTVPLKRFHPTRNRRSQEAQAAAAQGNESSNTLHCVNNSMTHIVGRSFKSKRSQPTKVKCMMHTQQSQGRSCICSQHLGVVFSQHLYLQEAAGTVRAMQSGAVTAKQQAGRPRRAHSAAAMSLALNTPNHCCGMHTHLQQHCSIQPTQHPRPPPSLLHAPPTKQQILMQSTSKHN